MKFHIIRSLIRPKVNTIPSNFSLCVKFFPIYDFYNVQKGFRLGSFINTLFGSTGETNENRRKRERGRS